MNIVRKQRGVFPSIFNEFFENDWSQGTSFSQLRTATPAVNIHEDDEQFTIDVAAPGLKKEQFAVNLEKHLLTISAETENKEEEETAEKGGYRRREFNFSSFKRSFKVPNRIDETKISAKYEDGVLKVTLPKKEVEVTEAKKIEIG